MIRIMMRYVFPVMNTDKICIFTDTGKMHTIKVLDIPARKLRDKGTPVDNLSNFSNRTEDIVWVCPLAQVSTSTVFFATAMGNVKLTAGAEFVSTSRTIMATKLAEGDRVILAAPSDVYEFIVLLTKGGFSIRFSMAEVAGYKRSAVGVRGIKLSDGDEVGAAYLLENSRDFSVDYMGKKLSLNRLKLAKRGGKGTKSR